MNRQSAFAVACAVSATAVLGVVTNPAGAFTLSPTATEFDCSIPEGGILKEECKLSNLIENDGYLVVGDKWFNNFEFTLNTNVANNVAIPMNASQLSVFETTTQDGFGLSLRGAIATVSNQQDGLFSIEDFTFGYDVHVHEPNLYISDIHLDFNPQISGDGFASVAETIFEINEDGLKGDVLAKAAVNSDPGEVLQDWAFLPEDKLVKWARIEKDVLLTSGDMGSASISIINQVVSQTSVPEPGTVTGLLAIGSLSVGAMLKRHFGKKA
ncbi:PEP-CTERM sorting domain-containing protein [Coleofasciculus chthonoplastes]|uniref:PEP-CTERM sorting domain-containing protein n=1 Tax=Coleofasciculus chthonoplastes TaxID=64178 RepID=UPI0032F3CB7B